MNIRPTVQRCAEALPTAIKTPHIAECKVHFECAVQHIYAVGTAHLIVGKALVIHINSEIVSDDKIDPRALAPLGRIGGRRYVELNKFIDV